MTKAITAGMFFAAALACGGRDPLRDVGDSTGSAGSGTSGAASGGAADDGLDDDAGECSPGEVQQGCPCVDGGCAGSGLACVAGTCQAPPMPADGGGGDTDGADTTGGGDGTGPCQSHADCDATSMCDPDLGCTGVYDCAFDVIVHEFAPTDCSGGFDEGNFDIYYVLRHGVDEHHESMWVQGGCPGYWPDETANLPVGFAGAEEFYLEFFDANLGSDGLLDALCFGATECGGPLPVEYLKAGAFVGNTGRGNFLDVELAFAGCR